MRRLERILPNALPQRSIIHAAEAWRALHRWPEAVGEPLAQRSWPDRFEKGTAWVAVQSSEWATELRMQKSVILARLREFAGGKDLIRDLRFGVRPLPPRPEVLPQKRAKLHDSGEDMQRIIDRILSKSDDET